MVSDTSKRCFKTILNICMAIRYDTIPYCTILPPPSCFPRSKSWQKYKCKIYYQHQHWLMFLCCTCCYPSSLTSKPAVLQSTGQTVPTMGFHWQAIDWLYYYSVLLSSTSGVVALNPVISYVNRHPLRQLHLKIPPSWANQLPKARRWFGYEPFPIYNISSSFSTSKAIKVP